MQTILKPFLWILFVFSFITLKAQAVLELDCNVLKAEIINFEKTEPNSEAFTFYLEKELIPDVWKKYKTKAGGLPSIEFEDVPHGSYRVTIVKNAMQKKSKTVINRNDVTAQFKKRKLDKADMYISNIAKVKKTIVSVKEVDKNQSGLPTIALYSETTGKTPDNFKVKICKVLEDGICDEELDLGNNESDFNIINLNDLFFKSELSGLKAGEYLVNIKADFPCEGESEISYRFSIQTNLENFAFYPNPAKQEVFFKWDEELGDEMTVRILDLTGKELKFKNVASSNSVISLEGIAPGVYLVQSRISGTTFTDTKKLIIQ